MRLLLVFVSLTFLSDIGLWARSGRGLAPTLGMVKSEVRARGVLLVDGATGNTLFARNEHTRYYPASITKLMTALLVYEKTGLKGDVTAVAEDTHIEPSHFPLHAGEVVSVYDLANALLIASDNDVAVALARTVGGTVENFVKMMNDKAVELGCTETHFENPNGLPNSNHKTSAADMMKIFKKVLEIPEYRTIMQRKTYVVHTSLETKRIKNHNKLLSVYPGIGPCKTGWTYASRHTYAASAKRDGRELLLIILNSPDKWSDAKLLFDYGFAHLPTLAESSANGAASAN